MKNSPITRRGFTALLGAGLCSSELLAQTAEWPTRAVRLVAPAPPGGSLDRMARLLAEEFAKAFGQPFVVENRPGAGSTIGTAAVASAPADGYTVLMSGVFNAITPALYEKLPYSYLDDFIHIAATAHGPNVLVAQPAFPHNTLAQVVSAAKANPGSLNFGSAGNGTSGHLTVEVFQRAAGIQLTHVPYKGMAPAMQDLLGGQVALMATNQDAVLPLVKSGKLKALAVTGAQRNPAFPAVPTFVESGWPDVVVTSWGALAVRRDTPAAIIERLRTAAAKALRAPQVRQPLEVEGWEFFDMPPAQVEAYVRAETERWGKIVRAAGVRTS